MLLSLPPAPCPLPPAPSTHPSWQAKLAPDLVDLLRHHEQSIDPNLIQLAEAWGQVQEVLKVKGELAAAAAAGALQGGAPAGEDGEEEEAADAGLGSRGLLTPPEDLHVSSSKL